MIAAIETNITPGSRVIVNVNKIETSVEFLRWYKLHGYAVVRTSDGKQKARRVVRMDESVDNTPHGDLPTDFSSFMRDSYRVNVLIDGEYYHIRGDHFGLEFKADGESRHLRGVVGSDHVVGVDSFGCPTLYPATMVNSAMAEVVIPKIKDDVEEVA